MGCRMIMLGLTLEGIANVLGMELCLKLGCFQLCQSMLVAIVIHWCTCMVGHATIVSGAVWAFTP